MKWSVIPNHPCFPQAPLTTLVSALLVCWPVDAADTAFRYQGSLTDQGLPADGLFDLRFNLHAAETGDTQLGESLLALAVPVTNGLISLELDFGSGFFNGDTRWLEIAVRPGGVTNGFVNLEPRQSISASPYALFALESATLDGFDSLDFAPTNHAHLLSELPGLVADSQLSPNIPRLDTNQIFSGTNQFAGTVLLTNTANVVMGAFAGDGAGITNLQGSVLSAGSIGSAALADGSVIAGKIAPGSVEGSQITDSTIQPLDLDLAQFEGTFWKVGGNSGVGAGFIGTTDDQPLELRVRGTRALRIEPNGTNSVNLLAGSGANVLDANILGATIAGGGSANYLGAPHVNRVGADFASVGGGSRNVIEPTAQWSAIGGGLANAVRLNAQWSTIAGGNRNQIETDADGAVIVGGRTNSISSGANGSFIGGGVFNRILTNASFASIPGGQGNSASGNFSFAAGHRAAALHAGTFVWADSSDPEQTSTAENEFTVRAAGGTRIFSNAESTAGVELPPGSGSWSTLSDRAEKRGFVPVDPGAVLERLAALPLHTWSYRTESSSTTHLGPTAQDFHALFDLGYDDRHISTVDADGVAMAGIQGLNLKLEARLREKETEIEELRARVDRLTARLDAMPGLSSTNP